MKVSQEYKDKLKKMFSISIRNHYFNGLLEERQQMKRDQDMPMYRVSEEPMDIIESSVEPQAYKHLELMEVDTNPELNIRLGFLSLSAKLVMFIMYLRKRPSETDL